MLVVVLTGPPGAGKSSTATAVHDALGDAGVRNALIEVDELERSYPALPLDTTMRHLRFLAESYRDTAHELLFVTATLEDEANRDAVLAALHPADVLLVRLEAPPALLRERIIAREPASWSGRDELVAASERLAVEMMELGGVDLVLRTDGLPLAAVAAELERAVRAALERHE